MEIVLQNIGKQFKNGTRALDHVTFTIPQGEFVSVIGPSGAGKTTLFRILNGMETPGGTGLSFLMAATYRPCPEPPGRM